MIFIFIISFYTAPYLHKIPIQTISLLFSLLFFFTTSNILLKLRILAYIISSSWVSYIHNVVLLQRSCLKSGEKICCFFLLSQHTKTHTWHKILFVLVPTSIYACLHTRNDGYLGLRSLEKVHTCYSVLVRF